MESCLRTMQDPLSVQGLLTDEEVAIRYVVTFSVHSVLTLMVLLSQRYRTRVLSGKPVLNVLGSSNETVPVGAPITSRDRGSANGRFVIRLNHDQLALHTRQSLTMTFSLLWANLDSSAQQSRDMSARA